MTYTNDIGFPDPDKEDSPELDDTVIEILVNIWTQEEDTEVIP